MSIITIMNDHFIDSINLNNSIKYSLIENIVCEAVEKILEFGVGFQDKDYLSIEYCFADYIS